ncbi:hypothetical protein EVC00_057 [Rhizobium phage RHph_N37]|uniref:Uncharacterized protein n=1 Tax=Rhizobium phage RHph_N37 TaxID=2509749 RepID=A0A7S5UZ96_9CAUD|nr:hypothetical protein EVC00_057 [Rhizobium phage RHph_N37]
MSAKELVRDRLLALQERIEKGSKQPVIGTMAERFIDAYVKAA